jgi:hypothetical protein
LHSLMHMASVASIGFHGMNALALGFAELWVVLEQISNIVVSFPSQFWFVPKRRKLGCHHLHQVLNMMDEETCEGSVWKTLGMTCCQQESRSMACYQNGCLVAEAWSSSAIQLYVVAHLIWLSLSAVWKLCLHYLVIAVHKSHYLYLELPLAWALPALGIILISLWAWQVGCQDMRLLWIHFIVVCSRRSYHSEVIHLGLASRLSGVLAQLCLG